MAASRVFQEWFPDPSPIAGPPQSAAATISWLALDRVKGSHRRRKQQTSWDLPREDARHFLHKVRRGRSWPPCRPRSPPLCQLCTAVHTSSVDWIWSSWNTCRMSKLFTASFCHCRGTGARYPDTLIGMDRSCRHSRATVHQRGWVVVGLSIPVSPSDQWIEYTELIRPSSILSEIVFDVPMRRLDTAAYRSPGLRTQSPGMRSHSFKSDK